MTATRDLVFDTLQLKQDDRVLTVRYSHPPLNFMTMAFLRDLDRLTNSVDRDPTVGAVVLTGGIEGRFLTHLDARELGGIQQFPLPQVPMRVMEFVVPVLNWMLRLPGLPGALERFGGDFGKGIVLGYRWKRTTLRMNRAGVVYVAAINGPTLADQCGLPSDTLRTTRPVVRVRQPLRGAPNDRCTRRLARYSWLAPHRLGLPRKTATDSC